MQARPREVSFGEVEIVHTPLARVALGHLRPCRKQDYSAKGSETDRSASMMQTAFSAQRRRVRGHGICGVRQRFVLHRIAQLLSPTSIMQRLAALGCPRLHEFPMGSLRPVSIQDPRSDRSLEGRQNRFMTSESRWRRNSGCNCCWNERREGSGEGFRSRRSGSLDQIGLGVCRR